MKIESLGSRNVLLTTAELNCFRVALGYQRKVLVLNLIKSDLVAIKNGASRLGWSRNPIVLAAQWAVLILASPLLILWFLVSLIVRFIFFPFRYAHTFFVPKDLASPGEKTLVGIYNAYSRYLSLDTMNYIACINDWIQILYGEDALKKYSLDQYITNEMERLGITHELGANVPQYAQQLKGLLRTSREKLSTQLGHYIHRKP